MFNSDYLFQIICVVCQLKCTSTINNHYSTLQIVVTSSTIIVNLQVKRSSCKPFDHHALAITHIDAGIISDFSLSAALVICPPAVNAAASIPAPSTPDVPEGTRRGPSDPCELTPATLLLLLLLRERTWKLLQLLWRVMSSVDSLAGGGSVGWGWIGGCFPEK